jgi:RNA polymerase sigma factor (sigma-70 family)
MGTSNVGTTDPKLLERVCDWRDHPAWITFHRRYDPLLRRWIRRFAFDLEQSEELCGRLWLELAETMKSFRFDPGRRFRGWLWTLVRSRAYDHLRRLNAAPARSFEDVSRIASVLEAEADADELEADDACGADRALLLALAERVQESVRASVDLDTWRVFWLVEIEGVKVKEAADLVGKKYTAAYVAHQRVSKKLRAEGQRVLAESAGAIVGAQGMDEPADFEQRFDD